MSRCRSFPATKLVFVLRAIADPEGNGALTCEQADAFRQVEANLNRQRSRGSNATARGAWVPAAELRRIVREAPADRALLSTISLWSVPRGSTMNEARAWASYGRAAALASASAMRVTFTLGLPGCVATSRRSMFARSASKSPGWGSGSVQGSRLGCVIGTGSGGRVAPRGRRPRRGDLSPRVEPLPDRTIRGAPASRALRPLAVQLGVQRFSPCEQLVYARVSPRLLQLLFVDHHDRVGEHAGEHFTIEIRSHTPRRCGSWPNPSPTWVLAAACRCVARRRAGGWPDTRPLLDGRSPRRRREDP